MKGRTIALGTLLVLCALLLCSCGRGGVRSEKEIMADMQEKQILEAYTGMTITEFTSLDVLKRQTNKEIKNDLVYVTVKAETDVAHVTSSWKLIYTYYDDQGWILDDFESYFEGENKAIPKQEPEANMVDAFFENFNDNNPWDYSDWKVTNTDTDFDNGTAVFTVTASRETDFLQTNETLTIDTIFDNRLFQWRIYESGIDNFLDKVECHWTIDGMEIRMNNLYEYGIHQTSKCHQLRINSIDSENHTIDVQCQLYDEKTTLGIVDFSGNFPYRLAEYPSLDLNDIQNTMEDKSELNLLNFLEIVADVGDGRVLHISAASNLGHGRAPYDGVCPMWTAKEDYNSFTTQFVEAEFLFENYRISTF